MTRRYALAFAALLAAAAPLATPTAARAQDDASIQMARERFQEGVKYYDQKQFDKARAAFLQAYALKKHPAVLLNLAQSELRSGREVDAAKHFAQYLRESKDASAAERQEAEKGLAAAKASVAEITVNVVEGADVYVDGSLEGRSPLGGPLYLKPGAHNVEARKDGKSAATAVTAIAGQSGSVELSFTGPSGPVGGPPPAPSPAGGADTAPSTPPAGPAGAAAPPLGDSPQADKGGGKPGFVAWVKRTPLAWVGGGLTALGLVGGVGFALAARQSYDEADSVREKILAKADEVNVSFPCGPPPKTAPVDFRKACATWQDKSDEAASRESVATVSFVVAGVAAAGTVVYYFLDTGSNKATLGERTGPRRVAGPLHATVVPLVGATERGLGIVGQF